MLKKILKRTYIVLDSAGINVIRLFKTIIYIPKFLIDYLNFCYIERKIILNLFPILSDYKSDSGTVNEYFLQDFYVAKLIYDKGVSKHCDIGSRIDGFISHLCIFLENITILDVRKSPNFVLKNINSRQCDISESIPDEMFDSVSCLHTLEHLGLGRYGDKISKNILSKALKNISTILNKGGFLYLSFPVSNKKTYTQFNANKIFNETEILQLIKQHNLELISKIYIRNKEFLYDIESDYSLGIYEFRK